MLRKEEEKILKRVGSHKTAENFYQIREDTQEYKKLTASRIRR